jgi:glycine cleavage system H protein
MTHQTKTYLMPSDRYYDGEHHMWVQPVPDTDHVVIGIDALALESMGDLAYVVLSPPGTTLTRGQPCGSLEAAKMTGELVVPVSGTIVEVNRGAMKKPSIVNDDNYGGGWLIVLQTKDWAREAPALLSGSRLSAWVTAETSRYRDQGWIR